MRDNLILYLLTFSQVLRVSALLFEIICMNAIVYVLHLLNLNVCKKYVTYMSF